MLPILGSLISAGTSLLGGKMASDATKDANAQNQRNFEQQMRSVEAQRDQDFDRQQIFAKQGIQWRAQDARDAGIHPLYALGANIPTYSGSVSTVGAPSIAADTSMGSAVASMGQDIGRAIHSTRTADQRTEAFNTTVQGLTIQKMGLENELLASQIGRLKSQSNPPFPSATAAQNNPTTASLPFPASWSIPEAQVEKRPQVIIGGRKWDTDPRTVPASVVEDLLGDDSPMATAVNTLIGMQNLKYHLQHNTNISYKKPTSWWDYLPSISRTP